MYFKKFMLFSIFFLQINLFAAYQISTADNVSETSLSSKILSNYLEKMKLTVKGNTGKVNFVIGIAKDNLLKKYSQDFKNMKNDAYSIHTKDNTIYIIGNNDRGLRYGIYAFLEALGCRFFAPDFEVVPRKATLDLNAIEQISQARFHYREIFIREADNDEYAIKNRLNGHLGHRAVENSPFFIRTFNDASPFALIPKMYQKIFPEYFCGGQLDFALQDVQDIASTKALHLLELKHPNPDDLLYISHEDIRSYCTSSASNKLIRKYASPSAPFVAYTQDIAKNIGKKYPDVKVFLEAYLWSRKAPKNYAKLPANMGIFFSDIEADFSKPLDAPENMEIYKDLKSWEPLSHDIYVWHYITNFNGYFQPFPDFHATAKDLKLLDAMKSVQGVFLQGSYGTIGGELATMRTWVFSKLLWNPEQDVDALISEFCYGYYGGAAKDVLAYLKLLNESVAKTHSKLLVKTSVNSAYLNNVFLKKAKTILETAQTKVASGSAYEKHLLALMSGVDYTMLMTTGLDKKAKARFKKFLSNPKVSSYAEGRSKKELLQILKIHKRRPLPPFSVSVKGKKWLDFQESALTLCCSEIVEDKQASDFAAVRMNGNRSDWGIQLPLKQLPPGKWKIYASVRIKKTDNSIINAVMPAIFYGVYGKNIEDGKLIGSLLDEKYHEVLIGTVNVKANDSAGVWIRPPNNSAVKYIFVDRIFVILK